MIIEYRVHNTHDGTIFPFWPQYRRKFTGVWRLFQFLVPWREFAAYTADGQLTTHRRFGEFKDAVKFLKEIDSPEAYYAALRNPNPPAECRFEKNYIPEQLQKPVATRDLPSPATGSAMKPCPFCAGAADRNEHGPGCYFTVVKDLLASPLGDLTLVPDLIDAWNTRA